MTTPTLLASIVSLDDLRQGVDGGFIAVKPHPNGTTYLLNYTNRAQYASGWSHAVRVCRGLVVDRHPFEEGCVVLARPFAKFANVAEHSPTSPFGELPAGPFEVHEKLDGSLIIAFNAGNGPEFCTRGSFTSDQAVAASKLWQERYADVAWPVGVTWLFEYVAPWNRIVVSYDQEELVMIGAIDIATGADVAVGPEWPGPRARVFDGFSDFDQVVAHMKEADTDDAEGFVVRYVPTDPTGHSHRAKIKYAEYLRVHRLVTGVSTLTIWENLSSGQNFDELLDRVPDEFYDFVTTTVKHLSAQHDELLARAAEVAKSVEGLSRKEAALIVTAQSEAAPGLVFGTLDQKDVSAMAWRLLRPEHETPSSAGIAND